MALEEVLHYILFFFQLKMLAVNRLFLHSLPTAQTTLARSNVFKLPLALLQESLPRHLKIAKAHRSSLSSPNIREIVIEENENEAVISAKVHPHKAFLQPVAPEAPCPICKYNINIRMEDVLILRQFLDHNHRLYSQAGLFLIF